MIATASSHPSTQYVEDCLCQETNRAYRVIQFSMEGLTGGVGRAIKRFDPREGAPGKA
jgi:hypothetical protein